jgi:hypothetical protein
VIAIRDSIIRRLLVFDLGKKKNEEKPRRPSSKLPDSLARSTKPVRFRSSLPFRGGASRDALRMILRIGAQGARRRTINKRGGLSADMTRNNPPKKSRYATGNEARGRVASPVPVSTRPNMGVKSNRPIALRSHGLCVQFAHVRRRYTHTSSSHYPARA